MTIKQKIEKLTKTLEAKYAASNNPHPDIAARCQVELFINQVLRSQMEYADQLLDEEIDAHVKAAA